MQIRPALGPLATPLMKFTPAKTLPAGRRSALRAGGLNVVAEATTYKDSRCGHMLAEEGGYA
jgi:hypothetical protein